ALYKFKNKEMRVLVATDIAARGLDIDQLSHVINFDLPEVPETYIHRMGRTGRAGLGGVAISFCAEEELGLLNDIQKHIKKIIPVVKNHPYAAIYADQPLTLTAKIAVKKIAPKPIVPKNFSAHDTKNYHHDSRKPR
ncbi:MAG: helicase-related protein, partial [Candidatus Izemoplasmatales bacterium]|nr:helicase-related protein [Candidatus Izemoplasmatales bacterium]